MTENANDFLQKRLEDPSVWDRIQRRIKIMLLTKQKVNTMKKVLINEAKPVFADRHKSNDRTMDELAVRYFDERIETLPKSEVYELYNLFIEFKNADGKEYTSFALDNFMDTMELMYSLNGWFREKMVNEIALK